MFKPFIFKCSIEGLTSPEREQELKRILQSFVATERVDTNLPKQLLRIISSRSFTLKELNDTLAPHGFKANVIATPSPATESQTIIVGINGMTCRSCEITVERKWKKLPGVSKVDVNCATGRARISVEGAVPSVNQLQQALGDSKYTVRRSSPKQDPASNVKHRRPSLMRLIGLFALVLILGKIFSSLGFLQTNFSVGSGISFGAIFVIGLVAASSSCIAITGGLLLSAAAKFNERYASARPLARMRPVVLFVAGRIVSYTLLGGLLGIVGAALSPSPTVTAIIAIVAAIYMLIMGLDMLHIAPAWLKGLMPRMPKGLSHRVMDAEGKGHALAPFGLGAATFFLPCGFTQALQLYALTTGSFMTGALTLLAFALGTAPALLALGWASSSIKGKTGQFFLQFSGALVIILGLWNIHNGLTVVGYPITLPSWGNESVQAANGKAASKTIVEKNGTQIIKMKLGYDGYEPNSFTVQAGKPVRWEIDGTDGGGCLSVLVSRQLGIQKLLDPGLNVIEFTPQQPGNYQFSCSMGMFRGTIRAVANL